MSFLSRLFGTASDPREDIRPLWHAIVGEARQPHWYRDGGVADTLEGRFDMITAVVALAILRMERSEALARDTAYLTELFVEDMDSQLRESGLGDPSIGKYIGKLVSAMGGRIGAFREALGGARAMEDVVAKNMTLLDDTDGAALAASLRSLADRFAAISDDGFRAGKIAA
ncbi:ubiquinol-cytochrome C chaperone family protein [Parerythrobacter lacustris]|uniref:Ubiquinol-cytochrome c chaperone domain-containing protein n=1 Tax=Parerythrobacter lacustris TaxID=2969984 RepID=A0ABT1XTY9_9SPHN|nr:ubiquinol-cytochrome C chaperone family protein [Parerythrobacter lacustris]MCR2834682.1 hypothetical protein [Parerythrobacter lacustris]